MSAYQKFRFYSTKLIVRPGGFSIGEMIFSEENPEQCPAWLQNVCTLLEGCSSIFNLAARIVCFTCKGSEEVSVVSGD